MKDSSNSTAIKLLMEIGIPVLHMKVRGKDKIVPDESAVYVCNHGAIIGPLAAVVYLPVKFRPWIHDAMLDRELAAKTMGRTWENKFNFLGSRLKKKIIWWLTKPIVAAMHSFSPISVSRTNPLALGRTLLESVEAMQQGDNILIFPDKPTKRYDADSFRNISTGFTALGKVWYKKTGKPLRFYPVFADKQRHTFTIGSPTIFDPSADERQEHYRVAEYLRYALCRMSEGEEV